MPVTTIPLILPSTARGWATSIGTSAKDQQLINGLYQVSQNQMGGTKAAYIQKRSGSTTGSTIGSGVVAIKTYSPNLLFNLYSTSAALFSGTTNLGATGLIASTGNYVVAEAVTGGVEVIAFVDTNSDGWFLFSDAISSTFPTFTGDRTSGSAIISGIASTTGIYKGQAISGTGIPANTRVLSVDSSTQITMDANATSGAGTATTITKEAVALITDADFPNDPTNFVTMDGYFFVGSESGSIYHSSINNPAAWASSDAIAADASGDGIECIFKVGNHIAAAGRGTIQYFYNAGNATGSVLSSAENLNIQGLRVFFAPVPFRDGMYCVGNDATRAGDGADSVGLYRLTGANQFTKISDDVVDGIIADLNLNFIGHANSGNRTLVLIHGGSADTFLVYDPRSGGFSSFSFSAALTSSFGSTFTLSGETAIRIWSEANVWTDSGVSYTLTAQTQPLALNGGKPFIISQVDLVGADTESTGTAPLSASRDDYATWDSVGSFDMTSQFKSVHALGWFPSTAALRVTHSANTNFRAQALRVTWEKCG